MTTANYLDDLGVRRLPPRTCPLDPGYDPDSVVSHLAQSGHLMTSLKLSTAAWLRVPVELVVLLPPRPG